MRTQKCRTSFIYNLNHVRRIIMCMSFTLWQTLCSLSHMSRGPHHWSCHNLTETHTGRPTGMFSFSWRNTAAVKNWLALDFDHPTELKSMKREFDFRRLSMWEVRVCYPQPFLNVLDTQIYLSMLCIFLGQSRISSKIWSISSLDWSTKALTDMLCPLFRCSVCCAGSQCCLARTVKGRLCLQMNAQWLEE